MKIYLARKTDIYRAMLQRWVGVLTGHSYFHLDRPVGKRFVPGELSGYYSDLSGKTRWEGPVDAEGLPLNEIQDSGLVYFPSTLMQKALGHWDAWLETERRDKTHYEAFLRLADWARRSQDERGGWKGLSLLRLGCASPYSALAQGEGISVLVRAFSVTEDESYLESARRALVPLLTPVEVEGTLRYAPEGLVLEEYPSLVGNTVLNGWVSALYGLYDFLLIERSCETQEALEGSLNALLAHLPRYDAGFWSFYDTSGNLASPFYHRLHIAQLRALKLTFPERSTILQPVLVTFERQLASRANVARATTVKAYQKLRHPPEVVVR